MNMNFSQRQKFSIKYKKGHYNNQSNTLQATFRLKDRNCMTLSIDTEKTLTKFSISL